MARMMKSGLQKFAPAAALAIVLFALALAFLSISGYGPEQAEPPIPKYTQAPQETHRPECAGNETRACQIDACPGEERCLGGYFGPCNTPRNVCNPGQRIACNIDGCEFGYRICDACGTGFGGCLSVNEKNSGAPCTGNCG
jgi:hypothetical protein